MVKLFWRMPYEGQMHCKDLLYAPLPKAVTVKAEAVIRSIKYNGKSLSK